MAAETECEKFARWLAEAEQAEQDLVLGNKAVQVRSGASDKMVTLNPANLSELRRRIADLRAKVAKCNGTIYHRPRMIAVTPGDSGNNRGWW